jgi:hypothetical protein
MFGEQMNQFQTRINETWGAAQKRAQARAKELEKEARKIVELLGDRAQAELKDLIVHAQGASKQQVAQFGVELTKLGNRLQELAKSWKEAKNTTAANADEPTPGETPVN